MAIGGKVSPNMEEALRRRNERRRDMVAARSGRLALEMADLRERAQEYALTFEDPAFDAYLEAELVMMRVESANVVDLALKICVAADNQFEASEINELLASDALRIRNDADLSAAA